MKERNEQFSYHQTDNLYAQIMFILFPSGIPPGHVWIMRYKFISYIVDKLCRYVINIARGGHEDSLIDISNYSLMLAAFDRIQKERPE
jgi:hypothetical protein